MAQRPSRIRQSHSQSEGRYSSDPASTRERWPAGFYTGEDREQRALEYAERPHGWGNYEANYDVARGELRRIDLPPESSHRGKGPKNYVRTDARIRELVCERLTDDPHIDARDIEVDVHRGVLTLRGSVPVRRMKHAAEDLAQEYASGGEIHNELKVTRR